MGSQSAECGKWGNTYPAWPSMALPTKPGGDLVWSSVNSEEVVLFAKELLPLVDSSSSRGKSWKGDAVCDRVESGNVSAVSSVANVSAVAPNAVWNEEGPVDAPTPVTVTVASPVPAARSLWLVSWQASRETAKDPSRPLAPCAFLVSP